MGGWKKVKPKMGGTLFFYQNKSTKTVIWNQYFQVITFSLTHLLTKQNNDLKMHQFHVQS